MSRAKRILGSLLGTILLLVIGVFVWAESPAQPTEIALQALDSDLRVVVTEHNGFVAFEPADQRATTGFIFYPGGRVDYRAYATVLRAIAEEGYFVAVAKVNLNLAIFDTDAADEVIAGNPQIVRWAVGGHSLGGVAAGIYAGEHQETVRGIVFWAAYPANDSLKDSNILVLSLRGTQDGLTTEADIAAARDLFPTGTKFITIEGGNHSQFGSYGLQSGDNAATISPEEQWNQTVDATVQLLAALLK